MTTVGKVILDVSVSLDGFIAGPNDDAERPLGDGGQRLHEWALAGRSERDAELLAEATRGTGAILMGRRTYDNLGGPHRWGAEGLLTPVFVPSRDVPSTTKGEMFSFVTDGIESAVARARAAAGDKNVGVMGGKTAQACLAAGLLDEIQLHVVPVLLGGGIRLFEPTAGTGTIELERTRVIESPGATHLRFRVVRR